MPVVRRLQLIWQGVCVQHSNDANPVLRRHTTASQGRSQLRACACRDAVLAGEERVVSALGRRGLHQDRQSARLRSVDTGVLRRDALAPTCAAVSVPRGTICAIGGRTCDKKVGSPSCATPSLVMKYVPVGLNATIFVGLGVLDSAAIIDEKKACATNRLQRPDGHRLQDHGQTTMAGRSLQVLPWRGAHRLPSAARRRRWPGPA